LISSRRYLASLKEIAGLICRESGRNAQERLERVLALRRYDREFYLSAIPNPTFLPYPSCADKIYAKMLRKLADREQFDAGWANNASLEVKRQRLEEERWGRQVEREKRQASEKKHQMLLAAAAKEIKRCYFEPTWTQQKGKGRWYLHGFKTNDKQWREVDIGTHYFYFAQTLSFDQLETSLLFTESCILVTNGFVPRSTCNDGLKIANKSWNDAGFKEKLLPSALSSDEKACMNYLVDNFRPNSSFEDLLSLLNGYQDARQEEINKRRKEAKRNNRKRKKRREFKPRRERLEREDRGGYTFDRAREMVPGFRTSALTERLETAAWSSAEHERLYKRWKALLNLEP